GLTGATVVAAATLGGLAAGEKSDYEKYTCFEYEDSVCPENFQIGDAKSKLLAYERHVRGATILAGVSGGLAVATLVGGLIVVRRSKRAPAPTVSIIPTATGVALRF